MVACPVNVLSAPEALGTGRVVPEVLRKSGSARCREDNFSRLIA